MPAPDLVNETAPVPLFAMTELMVKAEALLTMSSPAVSSAPPAVIVPAVPVPETPMM